MITLLSYSKCQEEHRRLEGLHRNAENQLQYKQTRSYSYADIPSTPTLRFGVPIYFEIATSSRTYSVCLKRHSKCRMNQKEAVGFRLRTYGPSASKMQCFCQEHTYVPGKTY